MSKSKSDSVETKGKSSLFHCDECEYSCEEEKKLKNHEAKDHVSIINSKDSKCKNCGKDFFEKITKSFTRKKFTLIIKCM